MVLSRKLFRSWGTRHSQRKTCPVKEATTTLCPSPEISRDRRWEVATCVRQTWVSKRLLHEAKNGHFRTNSHSPLQEEESSYTAGTEVIIFRESLSLSHRNTSPETKMPPSHIPTHSTEIWQHEVFGGITRQVSWTGVCPAVGVLGNMCRE